MDRRTPPRAPLTVAFGPESDLLPAAASAYPIERFLARLLTRSPVGDSGIGEIARAPISVEDGAAAIKSASYVRSRASCSMSRAGFEPLTSCQGSRTCLFEADFVDADQGMGQTYAFGMGNEKVSCFSRRPPTGLLSSPVNLPPFRVRELVPYPPAP